MEGHLTHVDQCPRCELRFRYEHELRQHLADEHDSGAGQLAANLEASSWERARNRRRAERDLTHRLPRT